MIDASVSFAPVGILMVCLGNICRSPTAHCVLAHRAQRLGLGGRLHVDSCGTSNYHIGEPPDQRSILAARRRGYDMSRQRARQIDPRDFSRFQYILAMDKSNLAVLRGQCHEPDRRKLGLLLDYSVSGLREVPDPYGGDAQDFEKVLDLVEEAVDNLLQRLIAVHFN